VEEPDHQHVVQVEEQEMSIHKDSLVKVVHHSIVLQIVVAVGCLDCLDRNFGKGNKDFAVTQEEEEEEVHLDQNTIVGYILDNTDVGVVVVVVVVVVAVAVAKDEREIHHFVVAIVGNMQDSCNLEEEAASSVRNNILVHHRACLDPRKETALNVVLGK
jgi:hypothetical protein